MEDPGRLRRMLIVGKDGPQGQRNRWRLTIVGIVGAAVLLGLVILIDSGRPQGKEEDDAPTVEITELIGPSRLNEDETAAGGMLDPNIGLDLPSGGWVQVADEEGNLAQQYRCEHLDPDPPEYPAHWIDMIKPKVELYLSGDRLLTITGDRAVAYAPSRALETGRITGNVQINLYEPLNGQVADPSIDPPDLVMNTPRAEFDNFLGKIICDGRIDITTTTEEMVGEDLQILMNDQANRIEYLVLAHLDYLLMHPKSDSVALKPLLDWPPRIDSIASAPSRTNRHIQPVSLVNSQAAAPSAGDVVYYSMTLHENIRILQGDAKGGRVVTGDEMHLIFSMQSDTLNRTTGSTGSDVAMQPRALPPLGELLTWMTVGSGNAPVPGEDDILLTCDKGVTMVPLEDPAAYPENPEETRAELIGDPVFILDSGENTEITCRRVFYHSLEDRFDLLSEEGDQVVVTDDRMQARGTHLWVSPEQGRGGFINAGIVSMLGEESIAKPVTSTIINATANKAATIEDDDTGTMAPESELDITWTEGVDLSFEPSSSAENPVLQQIIFKGDVDVLSPDGVISCQQLHMQFDKDDLGKATPSRMTARIDVMARNEDQTIWADDLEATFVKSEEQDTEPREPASDSLIGADTRVQNVFANGNVQVLLDDGARAFADELVADAKQETVVLTGEDVVIARDDMLIDHGRHVELHRKEGTATWKGPGQARLLTRPLDLQATERIPRPVVPPRKAGGSSNVTMRARWNEAMEYDGKFNEGAGSIELKGGVSVISQPTPIERNQMDGKSLVLQFAHAGLEQAEGPSRDTRQNPFEAAEGSNRVLEYLIARGDARLEQRTWQTEDRAGDPRIFYVAAKHITWNDLDTSAEVIGDGELVVRDPFPPEPDAEAERGLFKGPGTSRFVWTKRLDMVKDVDGGFEINMRGDVEGIYRGATDQDVATITAQRVEAITKPSADHHPPGSEDAMKEEAGVLDLGANTEIDRLLAEGKVYITTPRRRVDCHLFDYNIGTGLAKVSAVSGRTVSILTEGSPTPVRASSVLWNMDPEIDTITITGARGGAIGP